tara:strand:- start:474 stop:752 length:279 start_codon:yes stop_codon:yes gene_type:complete
MTDYAVVKNGVVENMIVWDGHGESPVSDANVIEATVDARIGGTYDGAFHYIEPPIPEPTAEQVAAAEARTSAIGKLKALGLNDAEIASITGG